ncbi:MAG: TerB family tellurite resistance protein [Bacteroidaceae bacterium]|nr:TerB family tellurite resistance protein [Bacteroidaceae bacterium]
MGKAKWIGAFFGLLSGGPLAALAGFIFGSLFDSLDTSSVDPLYGEYNGDEYGTMGSSFGESTRQPYATDRGTRNGFLFAMLTLAAYIIKADGRIMHSEMEIMRQFLQQNFGSNAVSDGEDILRRLFDKQRDTEQRQPGAYRRTIADCCAQLRMVLPESQRLQLLAFLVSVAKADGSLHQSETSVLRDITGMLGLSEADLNSMMGLGGSSLEDAYKVLEVNPDATDDEVKRAYKEQVKRNHPDRVAQLGEDVRRAAEEKMKQINAARDIIYQARGIS